MEYSYLLLWLEGPLQAWDSDSKFSLRDTLQFPTKSGVLGIMLSAMGKSGPQEDLLGRLSLLQHTVFSFGHDYNIIPTLVDYQVVGNGYDSKDKWEKYMIPRKRDCSFAVGGGTKLTYRHYLLNAIFAVIVQIPKDLKNEIMEALICPVWPIFLGRKTCVPSSPVFRGVFDTYEQAESSLVGLKDDNQLVERFRVYDDNLPDFGDVVVLHDVPLCFGEEKKYTSRYVTIVNTRDGQ